jgi:septation ring formation regulator EzrA
MESAGSASNSTMIAVIGSIIAVIIVGAVAGALIYKRYQQRLLELNAQKAKQLDQSSKINDDMSKPDMASGIQDEKYEQQYHPRMANVDIFGNGDII